MLDEQMTLGNGFSKLMDRHIGNTVTEAYRKAPSELAPDIALAIGAESLLRNAIDFFDSSYRALYSEPECDQDKCDRIFEEVLALLATHYPSKEAGQ